MKSCTKFLGILFSSAALVCMLPSCVTTPEKKHVYDFGDEEDVTTLPHTRPDPNIDGNTFGNMPQSR